MRPRLSGSIMFVFSDPGGAKPCLSLIEENHLHNAIAVSDRQYSFYSDFKTSVRIVSNDFEQLVDIFHPELIFTGTSYTSDIEKHFIKIATNKNIPCYSLIDHWTNISKRFIDEYGEMILPDKVWVIDERAKLIAIEEGIDESKLVVSGNPYHDWLKNWKPLINKESYLNQLGLQNNNQKILVYAPDPLSNINGEKVYGFDELSATSVLVDIFNINYSVLKEWKVLIKTHPNQDRDKLNRIVQNQDAFYMLPEVVDTNTTIYYSDFVMGFFSSFLIEAFIMNKPVIRFMIEQVIDDPIIELNIGNIVNKDTLIPTLLKASK